MIIEAAIRTGIYAGVAFLTKGKAIEVALRAGRDLAKIELRNSSNNNSSHTESNSNHQFSTSA